MGKNLISSRLFFGGLLVLILAGLFWWWLGPSTPAFKFANPTNLTPEKTGILPVADEAEKIKFLFFGDLMLDRYILSVAGQNGWDYFLGDTASADFWSGFDLVGANLEGPVTSGGTHYLPLQDYDFAFAPADVAVWQKYNFRFFNQANNHLLDQGWRGVEESRQNLAALGFVYFGSPDGAVDQNSASIVEYRGQKIAFLGLSMVYGILDEAEIRRVMAELKKETDLIIVNIHWGVEYQHYFNSVQQKAGRLLVDSGAELVIGHHPHVVQGLEIYQGKPIFYSLGNFIFDQYFSADVKNGLAVAVDYTRTDVSFNLIPFKNVNGQAAFLAGWEKEQALNNIAAWSPNLSAGDREKIKQGRWP